MLEILAFSRRKILDKRMKKMYNINNRYFYFNAKAEKCQVEIDECDQKFENSYKKEEKI